MYETLVLSLLTDGPLHAYLIADIANSIIGPWERISRGTLSTLIARLERCGFIIAADPAHVRFPSRHPSRAFAITPRGRDRFHQLMMDTTSNPGTYRRLFRIKALHLHLLTPEDQQYLTDHYLMYCQMGLRYIQTEAQDMATNPLKQEHTNDAVRIVALDLMALEAREWELEIAWVRRLRTQIAAARTREEVP